MRITQLHDGLKEVSAKPFFKGETGQTISLHLKQGGVLPEHMTKTPAVLVCIQGKVNYSEETGFSTVLTQGDFQEIPANVKHQLNALEASDCLLLK